jgi:hypothetical protein
MSLRDLNSPILGTNFLYKEFVHSTTAIRQGIDNSPNEKQWQAIEAQALFIWQPVRNLFGKIRINSGFRCPELNSFVGGSANSNHLLGEAGDAEPLDRNVTLFEILEFIYNQLPFYELIAEYFPEGWIHASYRAGATSNRMLKLKDKNHNYTVVSLQYIKNLYR